MTKITNLKDEEIAQIVRTSDQEAYVFLIKRYQKKLVRYATYLVGDENVAADAVQESFIKAYINLNSFDLKKKFSSWIYRIVHNETMNLIGKQKQAQHQLIDEAFEIDSGINLEDDLIKKELIKHAQNCLKQMPIIYKEPLSLYFLEEKSYEEISDILRIPMGTVATRINRAKIIVKKICQNKI